MNAEHVLLTLALLISISQSSSGILVNCESIDQQCSGLFKTLYFHCDNVNSDEWYFASKETQDERITLNFNARHHAFKKLKIQCSTGSQTLTGQCGGGVGDYSHYSAGSSYNFVKTGNTGCMESQMWTTAMEALAAAPNKSPSKLFERAQQQKSGTLVSFLSTIWNEFINIVQRLCIELKFS